MKGKRELLPGKPVSLDFAQKLFIERRNGCTVEDGVLSAGRARRDNVGPRKGKDFTRLEDGKTVEASAHPATLHDGRSQFLWCGADLQSKVAHG